MKKWEIWCYRNDQFVIWSDKLTDNVSGQDVLNEMRKRDLNPEWAICDKITEFEEKNAALENYRNDINKYPARTGGVSYDIEIYVLEETEFDEDGDIVDMTTIAEAKW